MPRSRAARFDLARDGDRLTITVASGIVLGYAISLCLIFAAHIWILDAHARPVVEDFAAFRAAGNLVLNGQAMAAYDPHLQHAAETAVIGHSFSGTLGWSYPPLFLVVAWLLALLPYSASFVLWCGSTLALYAASIARIAERKSAFLFACAAPWVLTALTPGQNGFLTAALIGFSLSLLESRPALAGIVLGLLSYKPQFGILFPLALAASGNWRAFGCAAASAVLANGFAATIFGLGTLDGFLHAVSNANRSHLTNAGIGWNKLQSLYGFVRAVGLPAAAAWKAQSVASLSLAIGVAAAWRAECSYARKAALLATATALVTPYVFVYDLPVLSVGLAFLARERKFDRVEWALLASTVPAIFAFLWLPLPTPFLASLAVMAIVVRRIYDATSRSRMSPSWATEATSLPSPE